MNTRDTSPNYVAQAVEESLDIVRRSLKYLHHSGDTAEYAELKAQEAQLASFLDYSKATPSIVSFDVAEEAHARIDALINQLGIELPDIAQRLAAADKDSRT